MASVFTTLDATFWLHGVDIGRFEANTFNYAILKNFSKIYLAALVSMYMYTLHAHAYTNKSIPYAQVYVQLKAYGIKYICTSLINTCMYNVIIIAAYVYKQDTFFTC